ncbi:MAG: hypothetical protein ACR2QH_17255 [Geminicoccaceae bacterium]
MAISPSTKMVGDVSHDDRHLDALDVGAEDGEICLVLSMSDDRLDPRLDLSSV